MCPRRTIAFAGAAEGIRTPDPRITNALLYQLSYRGADHRPIGRLGAFRKQAAGPQAGITETVN